MAKICRGKGEDLKVFEEKQQSWKCPGKANHRKDVRLGKVGSVQVGVGGILGWSNCT